MFLEQPENAQGDKLHVDLKIPSLILFLLSQQLKVT